MTPRDLEDVGAEIILGNTYHLYLRPGDDADRAPRRAAPVHRLVAADPHRQRRLPGVQPRRAAHGHRGRASRFRSHLDGGEHMLTPERAVDIQAQLGSDIAMVLDECPPYPDVDEAAARAAMRAHAAMGGAGGSDRFERPPRGAAPRRRSTNPGQAQFGIVQGGMFPELRDESVDAHASRWASKATPSAGSAVGEPRRGHVRVVEPHGAAAAGRPAPLPDGDRDARRPGGVRGAGHRPVRLRAADPQRPERPAAHPLGPAEHQERAFTPRTTARWTRRAAATPAGTFSRAYLRHLFMAGEMTAATLNSVAQSVLLP